MSCGAEASRALTLLPVLPCSDTAAVALLWVVFYRVPVVISVRWQQSGSPTRLQQCSHWQAVPLPSPVLKSQPCA